MMNVWYVRKWRKLNFSNIIALHEDVLFESKKNTPRSLAAKL